MGSVLLQVEAEDLDSGVNQDLEYSIRDPDSLTKFGIESVSGKISLSKLLDYERETIQKLKVYATDKGAPPRTGETIVFIHVKDSNDNPPSFEEAEYDFHLSKESSRGQFVGKVRAVDPDYMDNGKLKYSIIGGNEHQVFSIDDKSGSITLINLHNFSH